MSGEVTLDSFDGDERVEPAAVTSSWDGDGTCGACGESASRLWRDDDERVCGDCASWSTTGSGA